MRGSVVAGWHSRNLGSQSLTQTRKLKALKVANNLAQMLIVAHASGDGTLRSAAVTPSLVFTA